MTWFDRRTHLDPDCDDTEHEVYELEETDVNPIGCIAGKCSVVKAFDLSDVSVSFELRAFPLGDGLHTSSLCQHHMVCSCLRRL